MSDAPCWGAFVFAWKSRTIRVPAFLNNVARYTTDAFWNWLVAAHPHDAYIEMTYQHVVDGERALRLVREVK